MLNRRVVVHFLAVLILLAGAGASYVYYLATRTDELLEAQIRRFLAEAVPEWDLRIGSARFDLAGRIHVYDATLHLPGAVEPSVQIPETVIVVDREKLSDEQVVVHQVRLLSPRVLVKCDGRGNWDVAGLPLPRPRPGAAAPPELLAEDGELLLTASAGTQATSLDLPHGLPDEEPTAVRVSEIQARIVPDGQRRFVYDVQGNLNGAGAVAFDGFVHLAAAAGSEEAQAAAVSSFEINGTVEALPLRTELLRVVSRFSPTIRERLQGTLASAAESDDPAAIPELGIDAVAEATFQLQRREPKAELDYRVLLKLREGTVDHPRLPFPAEELQGSVLASPRQLVVRQMTARHGAIQIAADGRLLWGKGLSSLEAQREAEPRAQGRARRASATGGSRARIETASARSEAGGEPAQADAVAAGTLAGAFRVTLTDVPLDARFRERLPPDLQQNFDTFQPTGRVDLQVDVSTAGGDWNTKTELIPRECGLTYREFPLPVTGVGGRIVQAGGRTEYELQGMVLGRPVTFRGHTGSASQGRAGGADEKTVYSSWHEISVRGLPINDELQRAARSQPFAHAVLTQLRLRGRADATLVMSRVDPEEPRLETRMTIALSDGTIEPAAFPLLVTGLRARARSVGGVWYVDEIRGVHGDHPLTAAAVWRPADGTEAPRLTLAVQAESFELGKPLYRALSPSWQAIWDQVRPQGAITGTADLAWSPGGEPEVVVEGDLEGAGFSVASFSWEVTDITGHLRLDRDGATFTNIKGRHDESAVEFNGWTKMTPGRWQVHLDSLVVEELDPGTDLRRALPEGFRAVVESLNPRNGRLMLLGELDFKGTTEPGGPVTAAWDLDTIYSGATLTAGIDVANIHGRITSRGTWDGEQVQSQGRLVLDAASIAGHQFRQIEGPIQIKGRQMIIGSQQAASVDETGSSSIRVPLEDRISARAIGGLFTLDGIADLDETTRYHVLITMNDARLEKYAEQYLPSRTQLRGIMNGWCELDGRGSSAKTIKGQGALRIRPAALYELPVVLAILKIANFTAPDKTAFHEASANFRIERSEFRFQRIDLVGQAIDLRGRGTVGFDRRVKLDFYSKLARNPLRIPLVQHVIGEATKGWIGVEVRGTLDNPQAVMRPVPALDDALKELFGVLDTRMAPPPATRPRGR